MAHVRVQFERHYKLLRSLFLPMGSISVRALSTAALQASALHIYTCQTWCKDGYSQACCKNG